MKLRTTIPISPEQEKQVLNLLAQGLTPQKIVKRMQGSGIGVGRILSVMQRHRLQRKDAAWTGLAQGSGEAAGGTSRVRVLTAEECKAFEQQLKAQGRTEFLPKLTEEEQKARKKRKR